MISIYIHMSNITFKSGNILDSSCHALVNTVNCVGVMGKGIALTFKNKYPTMFLEYKTDCALGKVKTGEVMCYTVHDHIIVNFPTKKHWRNNSDIEYIHKGLKYFVDNYQKWNIGSIAFPKLGCTNGGLIWSEVKPIMISYLSQVAIPVEIYE
jgi:O-acetyl-ADP-ribose deacetylase (regulator of RNase III)